MNINRSFWIMSGTLLTCGALVLCGRVDANVDLEAVRQVWSDVWRDAGGLSAKAMPVSSGDEMRIGKAMANTGAWGAENAELARRVAGVGRRLTPHVSLKQIRYEFHVVESSGVNAFALPGGQIFVLRGMLDFAQSDAELASVLGHEIAHVDLGHCIDRYRYRANLGEVGALMDFVSGVASLSYRQDQELDADAEGLRLAVDAGYDAMAGVRLFARTSARDPDVPSSLLSDFLRSHPPTRVREAHLQKLAQSGARN